MANDVLSFSEYGEFFAEIRKTRPKNNKPASSRGYVKTKDGLHIIPVGEEQDEAAEAKALELVTAIKACKTEAEKDAILNP